MSPAVIVLIAIAVFVVLVAARAVRIVPQARAGIVERLGRYSRTLGPGLAVVVPFVDRVRPLIDLREQVVSFPPQPVITEDNLVVQIDTVIYFTVTDARSVSYEVANPLQAIEQLTVTTLRNVIGGMTLEQTLTSRDQINSKLRVELDEATGKWGIRVNRVELKSVDPPGTIQEAMEKQMRAERDRRATILHAEGVKQSQVLTAEGERQAAVLRAQGQREAAILAAQGEARAIATVFDAIHQGRPDPALLSYQYLHMLPQLAQGQASKIFVIPSEFTQALSGLGAGVASAMSGAGAPPGAPGAEEESSRAATSSTTRALPEGPSAATTATGSMTSSTGAALAPARAASGAEAEEDPTAAAVAEAHEAAAAAERSVDAAAREERSVVRRDVS